MQNSPLVSVIIPYYNELEYLKESVLSILNQDFSDFELLILDDGSKVNAEQIIKEFNDCRVKYIQEINVGLANNINRSLSLCKGKYIARLDQDDISEKTRLSHQLAVFERDSSIDCVFTKIKRFGEQRVLKTNTTSTSDYKQFSPFTDGCQVNSTMMIKRDVLIALNGYRQEYYPSDDWDLELRMSQKYKVVILQEALVLYRFHDAANTYKTFQLMQDTRRWAEENYFRRSSSEIEISLEDHLNKKSLITKIRHKQKDNCKLHIRRSGDYFLKKKILFFILHLTIAFIFHPQTLITRLLLLKTK